MAEGSIPIGYARESTRRKPMQPAGKGGTSVTGLWCRGVAPKGNQGAARCGRQQEAGETVGSPGHG